MKLKTHRVPMQKLSPDDLVSLVKRSIQLSLVQEIKISSEGFYLSRMMEDEDEAVLPTAGADDGVDMDFVLSRIDLENAKFDPEANPYLVLVEATAKMTDDKLKVSALLVPKSDTFVDYFGLPEDEGIPAAFMGIRVVEHTSTQYDGKLVVIGGPTIYLTDATRGIIIDMGA